LVNITIIVDQYKKRKTGPGIALSKNKEVDNYCNTSKETIDAIIERKNKRQLDLDTMTEDAFWDLFSDKVKENLISMDNLFQKKIDNLIMNNEYSQNTAIYDIIKQVKTIEFSDKEADLKLFYESFEKCIEDDKKANLSKTTKSTRLETNIYDNDEDDDDEIVIESEEVEMVEDKPLIKRKRNRTMKVNDKEEDSLDLSQMEDDNIDIGIPKANAIFTLNKQKLYLNKVIYQKLYLAENKRLSFGELWEEIDKDENNKFIKSKEDLDNVLNVLKVVNKIDIDREYISLK